MLAFYQKYTTSFKYPSMVMGIFAVLCLELGFTTFISSSDLAAQSLMIVSNPDVHIRPVWTLPKNALATLYSEDFAPAPVSEETHADVTHRSVRSSVTSGRVAASKKKRSPAKTKQIVTTDSYAQQRPSRHVVKIEDPYSPSAYRSYEITMAEASFKPKSEKRSLIASALPIVKKPYKWVKAIGSKLF